MFINYKHRTHLSTHAALPPDLFLMIKALNTVEGLGRALDPEKLQRCEFRHMERGQRYTKKDKGNK